MTPAFWRGRRVFLTGHTGFKGSWLTLWLEAAGAAVTGYALPPPTRPNLFELAKVAEGIRSLTGDVRDLGRLRSAIADARPEIVIHMAAQSLVLVSYEDPVGTYATNVMGTVNVLEAVRGIDSVRVVLVVTSDKCYQPVVPSIRHREDDAMGGRDPYSSSKGCAELVTVAYRHSFFSGGDAPRLVSVRAGNVVGGGDWAKHRLVVDLVSAFSEGRPAMVRNPEATRPWQFVLDPLNGYLQIAEAMYEKKELPEAWNFGPAADDVHTVRWIADTLAAAWGGGASWQATMVEQPGETLTLELDSSRARSLLGWKPLTDAATALEWTAHWYKTWLRDPRRVATLTCEQIEMFQARA